MTGKQKSPEPATGKMQNPFNPRAIGEGNRFFHETVINQIKEIFSQNQAHKLIRLQGSPGSSKTTTLKHIGKNPSILGEDIVSVYLNAEKYIGIKEDDVLYYVYKDIIEKLNKREYGISSPNYYLQRQQEVSNTILSILLIPDTFFKKNDIFLLIFDELDKLLTNTDISIIETIINYVTQLEKSWKNYALILAGDRRLLNIADSEIINQFLLKAFPVDTEKILDDSTIKRLITESVEGHITYDQEAIEKILWYSGKNLFFQQLICQYIFDYLHNNKRRQCTVKDVEASIQLILNGEIESFSYAWENKLTWKTRVLAAALCDESITIPKGEDFLLQHNKLLEALFGDRLSNEIEKLYDHGYIQLMKNRLFNKFPIKSPLYGYWIKHKYPFLRTILQNIDEIAHLLDFPLLMEAIENKPEEKIAPFQKEVIIESYRKWLALTGSLVENAMEPGLNQIKAYINNLSQRLNREIISNFEQGGNYFTFSIKDLNISILDEAICFIQESPKLTESEIAVLEKKITQLAEKDAKRKLTLFFHFQKSELVEKLVQKTWLNLISIDENDIKELFVSLKPDTALKNIIFRKLSLNRISPYIISGPTKTTFYGRSGTIQRICNSTEKSYAIVGARKIGKTSLLKKIEESPPIHTHYIYINLETYFSTGKTYQPFLKRMLEELKKISPNINLSRFPFGLGIEKLPGTLEKLSQQGKKIVFLFDEFDRLLAFDKQHDYELMRTFRSMSHNKFCQFIFAGFEELYQRKRELKNPSYNFYEEIRLEPLERDAALDLITKPMEDIGIHYNNPEDREIILEYTARHPNLLQFFCSRLINQVGKHPYVKDRRTILRRDINQLLNTEYEHYLMNDVYVFFTNLGQINRLILILLANQKKKIFSTDEITRNLLEHDIKISIDDVYHHLRDLVLRFILVDVEDKKKQKMYCFAIPIFPEILKNHVDESYKTHLIREIRENGG